MAKLVVPFTGLVRVDLAYSHVLNYNEGARTIGLGVRSVWV